MIFYKETEFQGSPIGMIPKDWEATKLSEASLLVTDGSHFSPRHQSSGYPLATVANMRENDIDVDSCYRITKEDYEKLVATGDKPEVNDVLFSKDGTVGQCIVFSQKVDLIVLSSIAIIRPNLEKADPYFLKYALQSPSAFGRISGSKTGSAIKRIILRDLNSIKVPLPNRLEEQKRIVEVLTVVDSAIELADRVIAKTKRLKKGLMQQLLTRGIGHTEYKQTPIGKIPQNWEAIQLKDVVQSFKNGIYKPNQYADKGIPCVRMYNIVDGQINLVNAALLDVTEQELGEFGLEPGDVVVNRVNTSQLVGKAGVVPIGFGKATFESKNIRVRLDKEKILPEFFSVFVQTKAYSNQLLSRAKTAVAQATITQEDLDSVIIPLPPSMDEQRKVAEIILTVGKKLVLEKEEKTKLENIKRGLMDLLLTGKVRIKVD